MLRTVTVKESCVSEQAQHKFKIGSNELVATRSWSAILDAFSFPNAVVYFIEVKT